WCGLAHRAASNWCVWTMWGYPRPLYQMKIYLALFEADIGNLHVDLISQSIANTCALANQFVSRLVKYEIVGAQLRDMYQTLDIETLESDKNTKLSDACDSTAQDLANMLLGKITFQPCQHIKRCIVCTSLTGRQHRT